MEKCLSILLKNEMSELTRLSGLIDEFGKDHELVSHSIFEINLVFDELVTNIIKYGYTDGKEHEIKIDITLSEDSFCAIIEDEGIPFNPLERSIEILDTPLEEKVPGGLGIFLVRQYMDTVEYKRMLNKNILTISKKFKR